MIEEMGHPRIDVQLGDVWIPVSTSAGLPSEYCQAVVVPNSHQGVLTSPVSQALAGPTYEIRFNLTAYVRDMIAEALRK
jgi:hypothetical protein